VGCAGAGIAILLILAVLQGVVGSPQGVEVANEAAGGNVQGLASLIFSRYVIAFESTAALLITAAVAAMVLAHPEQIRKKMGQRERAAQRLEAFVEAGTHPGPQPNSGVFARHNSIATPALLPDGSVAQDSVSEILASRVPIPSSEDLWAAHDEVLLVLESAGDEDLELDDEDDEIPDQIEVSAVEDSATEVGER
jgi:NADH-quinone oxidoreductase subunit J